MRVQINSRPSGMVRAVCTTLCLCSGAVPTALAQQASASHVLLARLQSPPSTLDLRANAVNDLGQTAGYALIKTGQSTRLTFVAGKLKFITTDKYKVQATTWSRQGVPSALPPLSSGAAAYASVLNGEGAVAGYSFTAADRNNAVAVAWRNGRVSDLGAGVGSTPLDLNASGLVLGRRVPSGGGPVSYFVAKDKASLKWLPAATSPASELDCVGLTDAGEVVCRAHAAVDLPGGTTTFRFSGYVWANGGFTAMISPDGAQVLPYAVSSSGIVAGALKVESQPDRAFLWQAGTWRVLPDLSAWGRNVFVTDVNNRGEVIVNVGESGQTHRTLLWNGQAYLDAQSLVPDRADGELAALRRLNNQGEMLVELSQTVNGTPASRFITIAPRP
jgi:uncharacterized membrane protein